jgi:hypothetical protein
MIDTRIMRRGMTGVLQFSRKTSSEKTGSDKYE